MNTWYSSTDVYKKYLKEAFTALQSVQLLSAIKMS